MGKIFGGFESKGFNCDELKWGGILKKMQQKLGTWQQHLSSRLKPLNHLCLASGRKKFPARPSGKIHLNDTSNLSSYLIVCSLRRPVI